MNYAFFFKSDCLLGNSMCSITEHFHKINIENYFQAYFAMAINNMILPRTLESEKKV